MKNQSKTREKQTSLTQEIKSLFKMLRKYLSCMTICHEDTIKVISKRHEHPWEIYTLQELRHATNNFADKNKIGQGGFGTVYVGITGKGEEIAVKRLKAMSARSKKEFVTEIEILARVRHKNLLSLRGFYAGGKERIIVYDYIPNHCLIDHLHGSPASEMLLDWPRRVKIALGMAEGIAYLHHEASPHIIHRDIKGSNVLLDANFESKVADFGFAKLIPDGATHVSTAVKGTLGYLAPEYAMWGRVSESCDVYSFGVLLLQLISGRKLVERVTGGSAIWIVQWAQPLMERQQWSQVVDPRLHGQFNYTQLRMMVQCAIRCTDTYAVNRPSMLEVVEVLKNVMRSERTTKEVKQKQIDNSSL